MTTFMMQQGNQLDQTLFTGIPHSASDEQLLLAAHAPPRSNTSTPGHFDPEHLFAPMTTVPLRTTSRAGHTKSKLGNDSSAAFLAGNIFRDPTSGPPTPPNEISREDLQVASSSRHVGSERMLTSISEPLPQTQTFADFFDDSGNTSFGMGISGISGLLEEAMASGTFGQPSTFPYALDQRNVRAKSEAPAWTHHDTPFLSPPPKPVKPPGSAPSKLDSMTNRLKFTAGTGLGVGPTLESRPIKRIPSRSFSKMRSCSSLRAASPSPAEEPLTPISAKSIELPGKAPLQIVTAAPAPGSTLSFSDLYNIGLGVDTGEPSGVKSPVEVAAQELLETIERSASNYTTQPLADLSMLNPLPTPHFGQDSAFSSPASTYLSDVREQSHLSPTSHSPMSHASYEETAIFSHPPTPSVSAGRQPCLPYGAKVAGQNGFSHAGVQPNRFAYPTRYMNPDSLCEGVHSYAMMSNPSQASTLSSLSSYSTGSSLNAPPPLQPIPSLPTVANYDNYHRNLQMFNGFVGPDGTPVTPKQKRTRYASNDGDDEEDEEDEDDDAEYVPGASSPPPNGPRKRLRTVASAPCLPSRRLKPGPKPKKSPAMQNQDVFHNAALSPPMPSYRGTSPYSDDERGRGIPGVPKAVIETFYELVPSSTRANGEKVPKRYACLMQGCGRMFPRKSAIESHIQTHLEDKPFVCSFADCDASFVRQHDLRRHERIHSGNKPFPCPCGKGFARGDALARHRSRGICSGSLVPRKS